jgi:hypothetical protein
VLLIRIRKDPHQFGNLPHPHQIKIRIRNRIRIRINLQMSSQNVWNMSLLYTWQLRRLLLYPLARTMKDLNKIPCHFRQSLRNVHPCVHTVYLLDRQRFSLIYVPPSNLCRASHEDLFPQWKLLGIIKPRYYTPVSCPVASSFVHCWS